MHADSPEMRTVKVGPKRPLTVIADAASQQPAAVYDSVQLSEKSQ